MQTLKTSASLKSRIISTSLKMTFLICLSFATGVFLVYEFSEHVLFEEHLESDYTAFMDQYAVAPQIADVPFTNLEIYIAKSGDKSRLPGYLASLPDGEEVTVVNGRTLEITTRERNGNIFYFVTGETAMEKFESYLIISLVVILVVICFIAALLGKIFANHIIQPVTDLATKVNSLIRTGRDRDQMLFTSKDEIEVLSQAIDSFRSRVNELLDRENNFSNDVSHELRTPLMGIQAAAENIQINKDNEDRVLELAQRIETRCNQMRLLIDSMLVLARDPDSLENDFDHIKLLDVIHDQLEYVSHYLEAKKISIQIVENGSPKIFSSSTIVSVIFGNLLRNAVQHSESDKIRIELNPDGFTITDYGRGLPEVLVNKINRRYSDSERIKEKGSGIGLLLVKRICEHFNWKLLVKSNQGAGTSFAIHFGQSLVSE